MCWILNDSVASGLLQIQGPLVLPPLTLQLVGEQFASSLQTPWAICLAQFCNIVICLWLRGQIYFFCTHMAKFSPWMCTLGVRFLHQDDRVCFPTGNVLLQHKIEMVACGHKVSHLPSDEVVFGLGASETNTFQKAEAVGKGKAISTITTLNFPCATSHKCLIYLKDFHSPPASDAVLEEFSIYTTLL